MCPWPWRVAPAFPFSPLCFPSKLASVLMNTPSEKGSKVGQNTRYLVQGGLRTLKEVRIPHSSSPGLRSDISSKFLLAFRDHHRSDRTGLHHRSIIQVPITGPSQVHHRSITGLHHFPRSGTITGPMLTISTLPDIRRDS